MSVGIGLWGPTDGDDRIVSLVQFEEPAGMPCEDARGALDVLFPPAGCTTPGRAEGLVGLAAVFVPTVPNALQAKDLAIGGTALPRDLSVQAILSWDIAAQNTYGSSGTIIARGLGTGATEYMPFAVELVVVNAATRAGSVRWLWHTTAGVLKTETAANFTVPVAPFLLTCTRRWISATSVVIRYYINDRMIGEVASVDGSIASSASGTTTIGSRFTGGAYARFLAGTVDEIAISNYEICLEEVAAAWRRISVFQPDGYRVMRDLMPPGIPISDDPDSSPQRDLQALGLGLGFADGLIDDVRFNSMPDRAYGVRLRRWEAITRQPPRQGDSLDTRRGRVVAHLRSRAGVSIPGVETAVADMLDCAGTDLEIIGFDNTIRDDFSALLTSRWRVNPAADVDVTGGALRIQAGIGESFPWDLSSLGLDAGKNAMMSVETPRGFGTPINGLSLFAKLHPVHLPPNAEAGIVFYNWTKKHALFFGLRNVAGVYKVGYQRFENGLATDAAFVVIAVTALQDHWLRIRPTAAQGIIGAAEEKYDLSYATLASVEADFTTFAALSWIRDVTWSGFYTRTVAALGAVMDVRFGAGGDFAQRNTKGTRPFYFYVYRDPALGGSPDLRGADAVIQRMKHGYTLARVITSKEFMSDDPGSLTDRDPLGPM